MHYWQQISTAQRLHCMSLCAQFCKFEAQWKCWSRKRSLIKMNPWQSETLTDTNGNLMVVNRGFSINWQNEAHQSHRGGNAAQKVSTHCGGSSRKCVSGTESCREGTASLSLSRATLFLTTCGSQQTSLRLILTGFVFPCRISNRDWLAFTASQGQDRIVKTPLNSSF